MSTNAATFPPVPLHAPELNQPLDFYACEKIRLSGRDGEALCAAAKAFPGGIEARADPHLLRAPLAALSRVTGLAVQFFVVKDGGSSEVGGFLIPSSPRVVFLNAGSSARIANIFAHEWVHALAKDPVKALLLKQATHRLNALIHPVRAARALDALATHYGDQAGVELTGNILSDALCLTSQWQSETLFADWSAVQELARKLWIETNPIAPTALRGADDADLSLGPKARARRRKAGPRRDF